MQVVAAFLAIIAISNAVPVGPSTQVVQGPSTKTTVIGAGGHGVIQASAPGGTIVREETPGYVASTGAHGIVGSYGLPIVQQGLVAAPIGYGLGLNSIGGLVGHGAVLGQSGVWYWCSEWFYWSLVLGLFEEIIKIV